MTAKTCDNGNTKRDNVVYSVSRFAFWDVVRVDF